MCGGAFQVVEQAKQRTGEIEFPAEFWKTVHGLAIDKMQQVHAVPEIAAFVATDRLRMVRDISEQVLKQMGEWEE